MPNKQFTKRILSFVFFTFVLLTSTHLQTTIWFSFFGYFPSPCFWIPVFVYLMMNRDFPYNFLWLLYFYLIFLTQTSAVPLTLFFSMMTLWALILFFQKRFSTMSTTDLILVSALSTFLFPGLYFLYSMLALTHPHLDLLMNFLSFIFTLPVIPPVLIILKKLDRLFKPSANEDNLVIHL